MNYQGTIIEESLTQPDVLREVKILETKIEPVTEDHQTAWVKQWTKHKIEIPENQAEIFAEKLSRALDPEHSWYADFKNDTTHFIIFRDRVFRVDRSKKEQYDEVARYGSSLGIPDYQLDFSPEIR